MFLFYKNYRLLYKIQTMYKILPNLNQSVLHQVKNYELISMIKIDTNTDGNRYYLLNHESKKRFSTMRSRCTSCGLSYRKLLFLFHPRSLLNPRHTYATKCHNGTAGRISPWTRYTSARPIRHDLPSRLALSPPSENRVSCVPTIK